MKDFRDSVGAVVIGRNEGERLKQCMKSVLGQIDKILYVDSGSTDGSAEYVKSIGVDVLPLDMNLPFSAARARNIGFKLLNEKNDELQYIQFIDGDCQCCEGWLVYAYTYLQNNETVAVVAGKRSEKYPEKSIYNMLCDIEWNTPTGEAKACGGDFMIRKKAFKQVGGFNDTVIAGEEPELCYRLKKKNWSIIRLDHPMTIHNAEIIHFSQWWKRCQRSGHAYAQGLFLHIHDGKKYCLKESIRIWFWAIIFPTFIFISSVFINIYSIFIATAYIFQFVRIVFRNYKRIKKFKLSSIYALFTIIGKWPEFIGQLIFLKKKLLKEKFTIIEYS